MTVTRQLVIRSWNFSSRLACFSTSDRIASEGSEFWKVISSGTCILCPFTTRCVTHFSMGVQCSPNHARSNRVSKHSPHHLRVEARSLRFALPLQGVRCETGARLKNAQRKGHRFPEDRDDDLQLI